MELTVIIPTFGRPAKLLACLAGLARQTLARGRFEVLVGLDGGDGAAEEAIRAALAGHGLAGKALACPKRGPAFVRNRLVEQAIGELILLLNDDVVPQPACLETHLTEQGGLSRRGIEALVLGSAPWKVQEPDRLFDRLVRETSMVFFYDRMSDDSDPARDWGFRHAWTLNLSLPRKLVAEAGWFSESLPSPRFEDIELAWRICARGVPVLYRPRAVVEHDHRYEPSQYLEREFLLGFDAWSLAQTNSDCAQAIFGRDIAAPEELAYSRQFVLRERAPATSLEEGFLSLAGIPAGAIGGEHSRRLVSIAYQQHLLLKRYVWRQGLIAAAEGQGATYLPLVNRCGSEGAPDRTPSSASRERTAPPMSSRP